MHVYNSLTYLQVRLSPHPTTQEGRSSSCTFPQVIPWYKNFPTVHSKSGGNYLPDRSAQCCISNVRSWQTDGSQHTRFFRIHCSSRVDHGLIIHPCMTLSHGPGPARFRSDSSEYRRFRHLLLNNTTLDQFVHRLFLGRKEVGLPKIGFPFVTIQWLAGLKWRVSWNMLHSGYIS